MLPRFLEALDHRDRRPFTSVRGPISLANRIAQPELDRVYVELQGELIHRRLQREVRLRCTWSSVGLDRSLVGRHLEACDVEVVAAIRPGQERARDSGM